VSVLIATAKASNSNSYATIARLNQLLGLRLYTPKWDAAASTPDAESYLANGSVSAGASTVVIDTGSGTFTAGSQISFAGHSTLYTVSTALTGAGSLVFAPVLTANVADDEVISRETANTKEKVAIWGSSLFDQLLVYYGSKQTEEQRMRWPRFGVIDPDGYEYDFDVIPEILEVALADFVEVLLTSNKFKLPAILGQGVESVKIGPLSAKVDKSAILETIPQNVLAVLSPLGYLEAEASVGSKVMPLRRS
jgi:hypothetical protein